MTWKEITRRIIAENYPVGSTFTLLDIYAYADQFQAAFPNNAHIEDKIRQTLQFLRDEGTLDFVDNNGAYRRLK